VDDHDAGPDNTDGRNEATLHANTAYRAMVPHHPLASTDSTRGLWHSFTTSRTKFIISDSRSHLFLTREDTNRTTVFGLEQLEWIKNQIMDASDDPNIHGVVFVLSFVWKSEREFTRDGSM